VKQLFVEKNFKDASLDIIHDANLIIDEYRAQGFILTLRQLYYQFVARDLLPNTQRSYKRLGSIINDARLAGLVDWQSIEDRTRNLKSNYHYENPRQAIQDALDTYEIDMWENQSQRVEIWIEKNALVGIIDGVCREMDVPYFACIGYVSQSEQWRAYQRARHYELGRNQTTVILHFGDHDPSGIDMTRDNQDRLNIFMGWEAVKVKRLALNWDQIEEFNPPPNPAKITDSRFASYAERYGDQSWELDALEPSVMTDLIRKHVEEHRDPDLWEAKVQERNDHTDQLQDIIDNIGDDDE
jgi:hypothetical protein